MMEEPTIRVFNKSNKPRSMENEPHCLVSGSLATVLRLSRLVGLAPLTFIKKHNGWRVSLSPAWNVYGYIIMTIINIFIITTKIIQLIMNQDMSARKQANIVRFLYVVNLILEITIISLGVYGARKLMMSMMSLLNRVKKINDELNVISDSSSEYSRKWSIILLVIWWPLNILHAIIILLILQYETTEIYHTSTIGSIRAMKMVLNYCTLILRLQEIQLMIVTLHVWNTFKIINNNLKGIILGGAPSSAPLYNRRVRRLSSAYVSICDVVRELNRSYGLILLLTLMFYILCLNESLYFFIKNLASYYTTQPTDQKFVYVVAEIIWSIHFVVGILLMIEPCHVTHVEMLTTNELVGELMRGTYSIYEPLAVELEVFHRHLVLNQVSYSPLMVITMSRAFVLTVFGSITTYLVVLVQIG